MPGERDSRMSAVDSAWLRMEDPANLMTITGVLAFERRLDPFRLERRLAEKLLGRERFRQRVVDRGVGKPRWEEASGLDLAAHLERLTLPAPGGQAELQDLVSRLMSTPLDFSRPPWKFFYVEGFGAGSALVARVHHCVGDGMALLDVLLDLAEPSRASAEAVAPLPAWREGGGPLSYLLRGVAGVGIAVRLLAMRAEPPSPFRGQLVAAKRAAWSRPIPLDEIKLIGKRLGGTINDVLLSAVAGALRLYLEQRGTPADGLRLRAAVPVNLRRPDDRELGNRFGLVFLPVPVGEPDPVERLHELKRRMDRIKGSVEALVVFGLLRIFGATTPRILGWMIDLFGSKATAVMTNVPGPRQRLYLCGEPIDYVMFWVPQAGHLGLGVSILSYCGEVRIGVATDAGLVPDPEQIVAAYHGALAELLATARRGD